MRDGRIELDFLSLQRDLYSAVIADVLDDLGFRNQAMDPSIRPMQPGSIVMGQAFTLCATGVYEMPNKPYEKELEAVDELGPNDVVVATTNGSEHCGFWGELLTTAAVSKGASGAIIDGLTRDSSAIIAMDFPVFVKGYSPLDSKGRADVISYGGPIRCGGVMTQPGDVVFGDHDGVVVIPRGVAEEALARAATKAQGESEMKLALKQGMGVVEAYNRYGIL